MSTEQIGKLKIDINKFFRGLGLRSTEQILRHVKLATGAEIDPAFMNAWLKGDKPIPMWFLVMLEDLLAVPVVRYKATVFDNPRERAVKTPLGSFNSLKEAAEAHGRKIQSIVKALKSGREGWEYLS